MKLTKSQLQFFFDEVLEKFDWSEEIEETTVDPLDYVLDEVNNMKRHIVNVEKQNEEVRRILLDQSLVLEQFQKLLGVATTTSALAKISVLMREDDTADRLLRKALDHLQTCSDFGATVLSMEIAEAFGESGLTKRALDTCPRCKGAGSYCDHIGVRNCGLCNGTGKCQ